jgi:hypothetical protein
MTVADRRVALNQLSVQMGAGEESVCRILEQSEYAFHAATDRFTQGLK